MKLTFIGNGNMAKSLIKGLIKTYEIEVLGRDIKKLEILKDEIPNIIIGLISQNNNISNKNIVFCVKPYNLIEVGATLKGVANCIYSVLAGTTIKSLQQNLNANSYIRTMPNLGATYLKSMTTITGDIKAKENAINIFNSVGNTLWVETQKELDIATAIAGSGPAFLAFIAESFSQAGTKLGLKKEDSLKLTRGLFEGFAPLLNDKNPIDIKIGVMSPGGTTEAGIKSMESNNADDILQNTINSAFNRALELAKK